ncbi:MAG: DUF3592 domain-containing protein [Candidatus Sulfotelmatobacter sp.]
MFSDIYDYVSLMFYWRWPKAQGVITAVDLRRVQSSSNATETLQLVVVYKFSLGDDGPYTGESAWSPLLDNIDLMNIGEILRAGQAVTVRYRRDNPSVNRLDRSVWRDLDGL